MSLSFWSALAGRLEEEVFEVNDPDSFHMDNNTLNLQIYFTLNNAPNTEQQVDVMLERVR